MKHNFITIVCTLSILLPGIRVFSQTYEVQLDPMSSENADFGAAFYGDGIVFCSNRDQKYHMNDDDSLQQFRTDLFYFNPGQKRGEEGLFSKSLTTWLNEGPLTFNEEQDVLYFTGNIEPKKLKKKDKIKIYKLGIFEAKLINGAWEKIGDFPFNDTKSNTAHPTLSNDGTFMIYASNNKNSMGAADLFITRRVGEAWSEPVPLPAPINSEANELFPFLDERNRLFFSSNRVGGDMDIFCSVLEQDGSWRTPFRLDEPINSPYDDFGYICRDHEQEGYYSSNRIDSLDHLFSFQSGHPKFSNCKPIKENSFCYLIEEEKIMDIDSLPLRYVWDLGDGKKAEGLKIKHCYSDLGTYDVSLSIVDTLTGLIYADVSELQIDIDMPERAYFSIPDTVHANDLISLQADDQYLGSFDEDEWYWSMGDGREDRGERFEHSYAFPGKYRLELGGLSLPNAEGDRNETCVYKDIVVVKGERKIANFEDPRFRTKNLRAAIEGKRLAKKDKEENSIYYVELMRSEDRIPFNSPLFAGVEAAITERFIPEDNVYSYNVGEGSSMSDVYGVFKTLSNIGFENMRVKGEKVANVFKQTTKIGTFIAKDDTTALNNEFKKLQDIKFEYDSHEIASESYDKLNYIVAMLKVEPSYKVSIKAHTDNVGGYRYNMKLSDKRAESVVDYFENKGIQRDQMVWKGFGDTEPIASNESEEGRALNRRVEFEIIEMDNTAEK